MHIYVILMVILMRKTKMMLHLKKHVCACKHSYLNLKLFSVTNNEQVKLEFKIV